MDGRTDGWTDERTVRRMDGSIDRYNVTSQRRNQIKLYNNFDEEKNQVCRLSNITHVISYVFIMFGYLFSSFF